MFGEVVRSLSVMIRIYVFSFRSLAKQLVHALLSFRRRRKWENLENGGKNNIKFSSLSSPHYRLADSIFNTHNLSTAGAKSFDVNRYMAASSM